MQYMFYYATAFNQDVTVWNICNVDNFDFMFVGSGQPTTNLVPDTNGKCIECPAGTTSGSGEYVEGQNNCTSV